MGSGQSRGERPDSLIDDSDDYSSDSDDELQFQLTDKQRSYGRSFNFCYENSKKHNKPNPRREEEREVDVTKEEMLKSAFGQVVLGNQNKRRTCP